MTFLGNSGVGKSTFMSNLLKPKNQVILTPTDKSKIAKPNEYLNANEIDVYT
jgi:GTP-binding protein EngB required for normal cell division